MTQAALYNYYKSGLYDLQLKRVHRLYKKRMQTALKALEEILPAAKVKYYKPAGGYSVWVEVSMPGLREGVLIEGIKRRGVLVYPGSYFYAEPNNRTAFRLSIGHRKNEEIKEGIKRVAEALRKILKENKE